MVLSLNILIVLVVYEKKLNEISFLKEIDHARNEIDLYIHDNSSESQAIPVMDGLIYFHDSKNNGVSHAYNRGYEIAIKKNKKCILLLDQDTNFKINDLSEYKKWYLKYSDEFIYAPSICDCKKQKLYSPASLINFVGRVQSYKKFDSAQLYLLDNRSVINSGLMIPLTIFKQIGGYNEKIKLDFSDVYFIERYKIINNYLILLPLVLIHSLSGDEGMNKVAELSRFKFYCEGAVELAISLNKSTLWSVIRRMLRLNVKYLSLMPIFIFINYYVLRKRT